MFAEELGMKKPDIRSEMPGPHMLRWSLEPGQGQPGRKWCGAKSESLSTQDTECRVRRTHSLLPSYDSSAPSPPALSKGISKELIACVLHVPNPEGVRGL